MVALSETLAIDRDLLDQILPLGGLPIACKARTKEPCARWRRVTSISLDDIDRIGEHVATGGNWAIILGNRLGVLDIDNHGSMTGSEALERLPRLRWLLEHRYTVKTGSGFHLYVELPPRAHELPSRLVDGLEWRTGRKYVMGPGSVHPDGEIYTALNEGAEITSWEEFEAVLEEMALVYPDQQLKVTETTARIKTGSKPTRSVIQTRWDRRRFLQELQMAMIPKGKRHDFILGSAIEMWRAGLSSYELELLLQIINADQCIEPLPTTNIKDILIWTCKLPRYGFTRLLHDPHAEEKEASLSDFLNQATNKGRFVSKSRFYEIYRKWALSSGHPVLNRRTLQEALLQRGIEPKGLRYKGRCVRGYVGIKVKTGYGKSNVLIRHITNTYAFALVGLRPQQTQKLNHKTSVVTVAASLTAESPKTGFKCDAGPPWSDPKG